MTMPDRHMAGHIYLSSAPADQTETTALRRVLEAHGLVVRVNRQELASGATLPAEVLTQVEQARGFVVLLTEGALQSGKVARELEAARAVAAKDAHYRLIPLVVEPLSVVVLQLILGPEHTRAAIPARGTPGSMEDAAPALLSALGEVLPPRDAPLAPVREEPLTELRIELERPAIEERDGKRRVVAEARLIFRAADGSPETSAPRTRFVAPLGPIEDEELRWYLERYPRWPYGTFRERARRVEEALPQWGQALLAGLTTRPEAQNLLRMFREASGERRISVRVEDALSDDEPEAKQRAQEAGARLLSLPWELLHDQHGYLFMGLQGARVRRKLHFHEKRSPLVTALPLRILLVCPRPEDEQAAYIDHRASALPVVEAVTKLGDLAALTILSTPTFSALVEEMVRAARAGAPYHVVHFDGHGVYDRRVGLGALCFESEETAEEIEARKTRLILGTKLAGALRDHRAPLVVLEACQSGMVEDTLTASVAGQLLQGGVASVVAMSHSVLVETARRFVATFYTALCEGQRVGEAMLHAQTALSTDGFRGKRAGKESFELQDWFVPVLYQEDDDPRLVQAVPNATAQELAARRRQVRLGEVPRAPRHGFVGRSRELLRAERMLVHSRYVTLRGGGGEGKTTLAAELAHWLVATRGFTRAALVAFDRLPMADRRGALQSLGEQLVVDFAKQAGGDSDRAQQLVERALREERVVLVFDNLETVLPSSDTVVADPQVAAELLAWMAALLQVGETHAVLTTREPVSAPMAGRTVAIGRLPAGEAIALVHDVLREAGLSPKTGGETNEALEALVETVHGHARALVRLAPEVAQAGVRATTATLAAMMRALEQRNPGSRETSLLASVELSLRRLPTATRARLGPLAVFHGGGQLGAIACVLGLDVDKDEEVTLARQLVDVGLAELLPYDYLRLDPALGVALAATLDDATRTAAYAAWASVMRTFLGSLYQQRFQDAQVAATLTVQDLPNLLAVLEDAARTAEPAEVVTLTSALESMVQAIGQPSVLARVVLLREAAARRLPTWSRATFLAASAAIEREMEAGRPDVEAARALLRRAEAAGEKAFAGAAYDLAICHSLLGRVLKAHGAAGEALGPLAEAERRFDILAIAGNTDAMAMVSICPSMRGDCLCALGKFAEAATAYEESIHRATLLNNRRQIAVGKGQLGGVRLQQGQHAEAIGAYREALATFKTLGEPRAAAISGHQLGIACRLAGQFDAAEEAFQSSLQLKSQLGHRPGEASTLGELGTLYNVRGRYEDAVQFYRRAAEIYVELGDLRCEGLCRHNMTPILFRLGRQANARHELERAIECNHSFGHTAEPWKSFALLARLEHATGHPAAATEAKGRARAAYLAYRRDGGECLHAGGRLTLNVAEVVQTGNLANAEAALTVFARISVSVSVQSMIAALLAILRGSRDPALADNPALDYEDAAELDFLLERLRAPTISPGS